MPCSITCTDDHAGVSGSGEHSEVTAQLRTVEKKRQSPQAALRRESGNELKVIVVSRLGKPSWLRYPNALGRISTVPSGQAVWPVERVRRHFLPAFCP